MDPRFVLNSLRQFALMELEETGANSAQIRRAKMKSVMRKGRLLELRIKLIEGFQYLVCIFRGDEIRVYYMDELGKIIGAENFSGFEKGKVWKEISRRTKHLLSFSA